MSRFFFGIVWAFMFVADAAGQGVSFDHITIDDGLANNNVNAIIRDLDGFMWFGTRDGLCRYDGYQFRVFKLEGEDGGITDNRIQSLFLDANGDLWVFPVAGGMQVFRRSTQSFYPGVLFDVVDDLSEMSVQTVIQDSEGVYWIGTTEHGVIKVDPDLKRSERFSTSNTDLRRLITGQLCYSFAEDDEGNIWFGLSDNFVNKYDRQQDTVIVLNRPLSGMFSYRKSVIFHQGLLWIGTEGRGVFVYDPETDNIIATALEGALIRDVSVMSDGGILIATDGDGLYITLDTGRTFTNYTYTVQSPDGLNTNALYKLYVDSSDNVWIGTYNGGVNLYVPGKTAFRTHRMFPTGFQNTGDQSVISFFTPGGEESWVGLDGGGLWKFNASTGAFTSITELYPGLQLSSEVITAILQDSGDNLWVGTFAAGLNRIGLKEGALDIYRADIGSGVGLQNNNIWDIKEDREGTIWLATLGGGLQSYEPGSGEFDQFLPEDGRGLTDRNTRVLLLDEKDNLWVGTERGGLNRLGPGRESFETWTVDENDSTSLRSEFILCIHEDGEGNIWIGTEGGGLHLMNREETGFVHFGIDDGMPSNVIYSIEEDNKGILWLSTSLGVASFDRRSFEVVRYDKRDGLVSNQFNPNTSCQLEDGSIMFGSISGLSVFDPLSIEEDQSFPQVVFTGFELFDEEVPIGNDQGKYILNRPLNDDPEICLRHSDDAFTITFAGLAYASPLKVRYQYRLEGFQDNWVTTDAGNRKAAYTNLDASTYSFQVRASNAAGEWPDHYETLRIRVLPAFWETIWFRTLIVMLVISAVVLYFRYVDRIRRTEHDKQLAEAEQEILRLRNRQLQDEVQTKNSKLSAALLQSAHKNKTLEQLGHQLKDISQHVNADDARDKELRQLVRKIGREVDSVDYWEQFQLNFDQIHQDFSSRLNARHANLTQNDIRLCCLIKINLTNAEIAAIQNISKPGVEKSKYRLKQKLNLEKDQDLNSYLNSLSIEYL